MFDVNHPVKYLRGGNPFLARKEFGFLGEVYTEFCLDGCDDAIAELKRIGSGAGVLVHKHERLGWPGGHTGFGIVRVLIPYLFNEPGCGYLYSAVFRWPVRHGGVGAYEFHECAAVYDGVCKE